MFIARQSSHIQEDIARNWSSWNFGNDGFEGTEEELNEAINEALESDEAFSISGFELWGRDIKDADIRELYDNYWVLVDNVNAQGGLSCVELDAETLEEAIEEAKDGYFFGDGDCFDSDEWELVHSQGDIHIFKSLV